MSALQLLQMPTSRPSHLIRVAVPRLNKCDKIEEYLRQLEARDYDLEWAQVDETKVLSCADWNELMGGLLEDRDWLAGAGGTSSWNFSADDNREFFKLSSDEQEHWKRGAYIHVLAVQCAGQTIYIDPQGYRYARYVAFAAEGMPEGMTRQERERERQKAIQEEINAARALRIANPPIVPDDHGLRFYWNGIKHLGGDLFKCSYSGGTLTHYPEGTITIYASDYRRFPEEIARHFHVENNSDSQSDYFDDDKVRVCPNHPLWSATRAAFDAQEQHREKTVAKRNAKYSRA